MTLYGIDVARYQSGMSLAKVKAEGFSWVEARASTGYLGGSVDTAFHGFKTSAASSGLLFVAYHFLYSSKRVSIAHQAAVCASAIGDTRCPVMIDHETADDTGTPTVADAVAFADAMRGKGYRVPLWYLPRWVWQRLGSPRLPNTGMALVASSYVAGHGYASSLYPGAGSWPGSYGGLRPTIWQFTDTAEVAGHSVDADAFEGTYAELQTLLDPASQGDDMPLSPADLAAIWGERLTDPRSKQTYTALEWLAGANENAWNALQQVDAIKKELDAIKTQLAAAGTSGVDVNALAAALAQHLQLEAK